MSRVLQDLRPQAVDTAALFAAMKAEIEELKAKLANSKGNGKPKFHVCGKGEPKPKKPGKPQEFYTGMLGVRPGQSRFCTYLYPEQWHQILDMADEIRAEIEKQADRLSWKSEYNDND